MTLNKIRHRALARLGHKLKRQGSIDSVSPGLGKFCEFISRQTGVPIGKDKASMWQAVVEFEAQLNGGYHLRTPTVPTPIKAKKAKAKRFDAETFKAFYYSREWRTLRYEALRKHGAACQCCGATAISSGRPMHVDHIKPRSRFPELELSLSNLQVLCEDCNMGKGGRDQTDWRH